MRKYLDMARADQFEHDLLRFAILFARLCTI